MTDTPDQDSDLSSAITSAAGCLGNLKEETHPHRASRIAALISSLFYHEALDTQKLSFSPKLICQESKLRKERFIFFFKHTLPKDVHFLRWFEAKLSILLGRNIVQHTPPWTTSLCGPGLPGIPSGALQIPISIKRALRNPSRRQGWDSTPVVFLSAPKSCCEPQRDRLVSQHILIESVFQWKFGTLTKRFSCLRKAFPPLPEKDFFGFFLI